MTRLEVPLACFEGFCGHDGCPYLKYILGVGSEELAAGKTEDVMTRFWFKTSEQYLSGPWTMAGVLASSWEEAVEVLLKSPETPEIFFIPQSPTAPHRYYLSCNAIMMIAQECEEPATVLVKLPAAPKKGPLKPLKKASKATQKAA
jgi:hypothetical protein